MAATNFTPIILYHTTTASAAPTAGNLNNGELAINITDGKLFYKDNGGTVQVIATKGTGTIGGSNTQVQYNSSGALAGSANFTFNGTTATINTLNLTNALGTTFGGTGLNAYTTGDLVYASGTNTLAKLGIGLNTYILTSTGSVPQWSAPSAVTVATANNLAGGAAGSVPYQSGAGVTTFLSIGTANQVLTSSGTAPQWSNLSSLGVSSLSFGTTGLTPSTATQGAITVGGTLATTNGGTGLSSFVANRVFYSSSTSAIGQSANLTFDGNLLTAANFTDSSLTAGRITYAGAGGNLTDSASLTFDGTTLFSPNFWASGDGNGLTLRNAANNGGGVIVANTGSAGGIRISSDAGPMALESGGSTTLTLTAAQAANFAAGVYLNNAQYYHSKTTGGTNIRMLGLNSGNTAYVGPIDAGPGDMILNASSTSTNIQFYASGTGQMSLTTTGLGLNQSSPICKLDVREGNRGNFTNIANVGVYTTNNPAIDFGGSIALGGRFAAASQSEAPFASIRGAKENATDNNYNGYLSFQTIQNSGVLTERARFSSVGYLGINNTSPNAYLDILAPDATTADLARFRQTNQGNLLIQSQQGGQSIGGANGILFSNATGGMGWRTNASSGDANMLLTTGGDLGLGTVSPSAKFHAQIPAVTNSNVEMMRLTDGTYADFKVLLNRATTLGGSLARLNTATNNMGFETANTERMRLVSSELIIGGTSTGYGTGSTRQTNVASSSGIVTGLVLQNSANNTNGQGVALFFKNSVWNGGGIEDAKAGYIKYVSAANFGEQGILVFGTNNGYGVAPIDRMQLSYNGSLYVGETSESWEGQAGITIGRYTESLNAKNFIRVNNRGVAASTTAYTVGGVVFSAYRDVRNPCDIAAVYALRTAYAGGLASDGTLVFGTELTDGGSIEVDGTLPQERGRFTPAGNFFVGATDLGTVGSTTGAGLYGSGIVAGSAVSDTSGIFARRSTDGGVVSFRRDSTQVGTVSVTTTATAYNTSSDYRLKDNQQPLVGSGLFIDALKPKTWNWKADGSKGVGFIAHEVQEVSPGSVVGEKDAVDKKGKPVYQVMEYGSAEFIANIIAELQSLRKRVAQLEQGV